MYKKTFILALFTGLSVSAAVTTTPDLKGKVSNTHIDEVKRIFQRFTNILGKDMEDYTLEIQQSDQLNAYATLGKKIVINSALLEQIKSESAIGFVIAHELGHVEKKHAMKGIAVSGFSALLKHFFFKDSRLAAGVNQAGTLYYNRGQEESADHFAIDLINKTYCQTPGKLEFFEKLAQNKSSPKILEYFSTHPLPETRLEYLRKEIKDANCVL